MFYMKHKTQETLIFDLEKELCFEKQEKLKVLSELISHWGENYHIVSQHDQESIWRRHIVDCLQIVPFVKSYTTLMDVGAGFGFPTIPLAIACPELKITVIEPNLKKSEVCRYTLQKLGLHQVEVISKRVEEVEKTVCDVVCCRAWGEFKKNARTVHQRLRKQGIFITFKRQAEKETPKGYQNLQNYSYCLKESHPTYHIVQVEKE